MPIIGSYSSLTEAAKITQSKLLSGIVKEVYRVGEILPRFPIEQVNSYSLQYNREVEASGGHFVAIGADIPSDADITYTQVEVFLKRYIKQRDLDHFLADTWTNINDPEAQAMQRTVADLMAGLESELIYSNNTADSETFNGLHSLVASGQQLHQGSGTTGAALSLINLDALTDLVRPKADFLLINRALYRRLGQMARSGTTSFPLVWSMSDATNGGFNRVLYWNDVEIIPTEYITLTETIASGAYALKVGGATTTIFAGRWGNILAGGLCLLMGSPLFDPVKIADLENKDASRFRIKSYIAPALGSTKALASLDGITNVAVVA